MAIDRGSNIPYLHSHRPTNQLEGHKKCPPHPTRKRGKALRHEQDHHPETLRSEAHVKARRRRVALRDEKDPKWRSRAKEKAQRNAELRRERERLQKEANARAERLAAKNPKNPEGVPEAAERTLA